MAKISGSAIAGKSQDKLAYYHVAVLEKGSGLSVYAQCVTFSPKDPVPTGSAYNVGSLFPSLVYKPSPANIIEGFGVVYEVFSCGGEAPATLVEADSS